MALSIILPLLVSGVGIFLLFKLRLFFIIHPKRTVRGFLSSLEDKESRRALCLALAGTLGVGNIFGVCAGLMIGGAGSVFWLLVSSLFSMIIKYSETLLSCELLSENDGGMHVVIKSSFKKCGKAFSLIYVTLFLFLALLMGAAMQSRAAYSILNESLGINGTLFSVVFLFVLIISFAKNGEKIEKITAFVIPLTTIIYIIVALFVIFDNISELYGAISLVFKEAFQPMAGVGGGVSFLFSCGLKEGFARGILSNEAGVGTSAMAHSRARKRDPATAGLYGMCEVFFDTVILCPLTAFMVLVSINDISLYSTPMALVFSAVEGTLGNIGQILLAFSVLSFAYATVCCWFYYGKECLTYLFSKEISKVFLPLFLTFVTAGVFSPDRLLLSFTDTVLLFMSIITLSVIIKESGLILRSTRQSGLIGKKNKKSCRNDRQL